MASRKDVNPAAIRVKLRNNWVLSQLPCVSLMSLFTVLALMDRDFVAENP
jgi:hypothetical protein